MDPTPIAVRPPEPPRTEAGAALDSVSASAGASGSASAGAGAGAGTAAAGDSTPGSGTPSSLVKTAVTERGNQDHPFFHYYGLLPHQQNMLQDAVRTGTYKNAITLNPSNFAGKVVLDVGTGTGILAYFAVQAGARHVYAVEASNMAEVATKLMAANGLSDRVTVIRGKVDEVTLPEKVDVIVSEPMGFMLVHERMLESYIAARDLFLKPGGLMMPTTGTIYIAPFSDRTLYAEQCAKPTFWSATDFYGLNLSLLQAAARADYFSQPVVGYFDPSILLCPETITHVINFQTDTVADLAEIVVPLDFVIAKTELMHGLAAWFDVGFAGKDLPTVLSTGPGSPGTHWYQCRLLLQEPIAVNATQRVKGQLKMVVNDKFSYNLTLTMTLDGTTISSTNHINLHDQMYHYLQASATAAV